MKTLILTLILSLIISASAFSEGDTFTAKPAMTTGTLLDLKVFKPTAPTIATFEDDTAADTTLDNLLITLRPTAPKVATFDE